MSLKSTETKTYRYPVLSLRILLSFVFIITTASCATRFDIPTYQDSLRGDHQLSDEEIYLIEESDKVYSDIKKNGLIISDKQTQAFLNDILRHLLGSTEATSDIEVHIIRSPHLNAYATGNRKIYINSGMFSVMDSAEQFAALVSHELAHLLERHNLKSLVNRKNKITNAKVASLFTLGLAMQHTNLSLAKYTLNHEFEADTVALKLMRDAGFNPTALLALVRNLEEASKKLEPHRISETPLSGQSQRVKRLIDNIERYYELENLSEESSTNRKTLFNAIKAERMLDNVAMRLRSRQYHLALHDLDFIESNGIPVSTGFIEYSRGVAYSGLSKNASKMIKKHETSRVTSQRNYEALQEVLDSEIAKYNKKSKIYLQSAFNTNEALTKKAALKLGEVYEREGKTKTAINWYQRYRALSDDQRDLQYADQLIDQATSSTTVNEI